MELEKRKILILRPSTLNDSHCHYNHGWYIIKKPVLWSDVPTVLHVLGSAFQTMKPFCGKNKEVWFPCHPAGVMGPSFPSPSCTRPSSICSLSFVGSHAKNISLAPATLVYPRWNVFWENLDCYCPIEAKEWTGSQRRPWISNYFYGNRMFAYSYHTIFKTASLEVIINSQEVVMRIQKGPMDPSPSFSHW